MRPWRGGAVCSGAATAPKLPRGPPADSNHRSSLTATTRTLVASKHPELLPLVEDGEPPSPPCSAVALGNACNSARQRAPDFKCSVLSSSPSQRSKAPLMPLTTRRWQRRNRRRTPSHPLTWAHPPHPTALAFPCRHPDRLAAPGRLCRPPRQRLHRAAARLCGRYQSCVAKEVSELIALSPTRTRAPRSSAKPRA